MWQDWVISIIQWGFIFTILPTVFDSAQKPALLTSLASAGGLFFFAATYATLDLWSSTISSLILGSEWAFLAYQRWRLDHRSARTGLE